MKKRLLQIAIISVEVVGVILAVFLAAGAYLFWQLDRGPVDLALIEGVAESAIERQLPEGHRARIEQIILTRDKANDAYDVRIKELSIADDADERLVSLEEAKFSFTAREVLNARLLPRRISLQRPEINLKRRADNRFTIRYIRQTNTTDDDGNILSLLKSNKYFQTVFESAELVNAQIIFEDELSGRKWESEGGSALIERSDNGFLANVAANFKNERGFSQSEIDIKFDQDADLVTAMLNITDAPLSDLLDLFYGQKAAILTAPVTGTAEIKMSGDGKILSCKVNGRAGNGQLNLGNVSSQIENLALAASYDPQSAEFIVDRFTLATDRGTGEFVGAAQIEFAANTNVPTKVAFEFRSEAFSVGENGIFSNPIDLTNLAFAGQYNVDNRRFTLSSLTTDFLGVTANATLAFQKPRTPEGGQSISPEIKVDIELIGDLDPERILAGWPKGVGLATQIFIRDRIFSGRVSNVVGKLDLEVGEFDAAGGVPNEALSVKFDIFDAVIDYIPGMTVLSKAGGAAELNGNKFFIDVNTARVGDISITGGEIDFTAFRPSGSPSFFRFDAVGDVDDMLLLLDQKPLSLFRATSLDPAKFSGNAKASIEIFRPNRRDVARHEYKVTGNATFENLGIEEIYGVGDFTDASGSLQLKPEGMTVLAEGDLGGTPIKVDWEQNFFAERNKATFNLTGEVGSSTGDFFGIATRQLLRGPVTYNAKVVGDLSYVDSITLDLDFTRAELFVDQFSWTKPKDQAANGKLALSFDDTGIDIQDIRLLGAGVDLSGRLRISTSGQIEAATIDRFFLDGAADFSAKMNRTDVDGLDVFLSGPFMNVAPFLEQSTGFANEAAQSENVEREPSRLDNLGNLSIVSRIDTLQLRNEVQYSDVDFDFRRDGQDIQEFTVSARDTDGNPLSVDLSLTGNDDGPSQVIEARTDDIGTLLSGVFGIKSIIGGQGVVSLFVRDQENGSAPVDFTGINGVLEARQIKIVGMPLLAKIFAAGSFTGLADILNGDGIEISQAFADFAFGDEAVILRDLRAAGPAVGLSAEGRIAAEANGGLDLNGAVAPVYQVNSFLGKAPLVGDLFVNRDGEGVVALSYAVSGNAATPTVTVNPLSALTPGFLRRIFEPERSSLEEVMSVEGAPADSDGEEPEKQN